MKARILMSAMLAAFAGLAQATEYGQVISSTPVSREVMTPQRVCRNEEVVVEKPHDASGSVIGAVAGGILGSTVGRGSGRAAATAAGVIVGAVAGDKVANPDDTATSQTVRRCSTQQVRSLQTVGYDVEYEYAGKTYRTRVANDPGDRIAVQVTPLGSGVVDDDATLTSPPPLTVIDDSPRVVYLRERPAPPPVSVHLGWGWWGGPGPRRHW